VRALHSEWGALPWQPSQSDTASILDGGWEPDVSKMDKLPGEAVEMTDEELLAPFHGVLEYARRQAQTDEQRDIVMNALYDVFTRVEPDVGEAHDL